MTTNQNVKRNEWWKKKLKKKQIIFCVRFWCTDWVWRWCSRFCCYLFVCFTSSSLRYYTLLVCLCYALFVFCNVVLPALLGTINTFFFISSTSSLLSVFLLLCCRIYVVFLFFFVLLIYHASVPYTCVYMCAMFFSLNLRSVCMRFFGSSLRSQSFGMRINISVRTIIWFLELPFVRISKGI